MSDEKKDEKEKETPIIYNEKRTLNFQNDVVFEFELDVSTPEAAVTEIADFIALMEEAKTKLTALQKEFAGKFEKPKVEAKKTETAKE